MRRLFILGLILSIYSTNAYAIVTDSEAVSFANNKVRPMADRLAQTYYACKEVKNEWDANNLGGTVMPINGGNVVDGSATDGRHPITGNDVHGVIARCNDLVTDYEALVNTKLNSVLNVAVNK